MCFGQWQQATTHLILLMPFQEEKASDTCSKHDETNDDSDDDSILDILDCCTDEEENAQPADELNAELVQTYSVVDPIPVDLASYTHLYVQ